jgi:ribosomal protein L31
MHDKKILELEDIHPSRDEKSGKIDGGSVTAEFELVHTANTRRTIAYSIMVLLAVVVSVEIFISIHSIFTGVNDCSRRESALSAMATIMNPIFTAVIGLVGSVLGFYFGSEKH